MILVELIASKIVESLVRLGMISEADRKAAEQAAVKALLERDLPDDVGADWRKLHGKG